MKSLAALLHSHSIRLCLQQTHTDKQTLHWFKNGRYTTDTAEMSHNDYKSEDPVNVNNLSADEK